MGRSGPTGRMRERVENKWQKNVSLVKVGMVLIYLMLEVCGDEDEGGGFEKYCTERKKD